MYYKRFIGTGLFLTLLTLLTVGQAFADERINMPPYHFGGDALFCEEATGCTLLDQHGQLLWNWPQADIVAAFDNLDLSGQNTLVGAGTGSYGAAMLWTVQTGETNGNKKLCYEGIDEWDKQNDMCFDVTLDQHYESAPLPAPAPIVIVVVQQK
ncbi:MAG: hypothetical protein ABI690_19230 [Chloroflexota bacterium]